MEYIITNDKEIEKELNISVPCAELERFIDREIKKLQKELTLKGFRKGKVPKEIIKSRYRDTLKSQAMHSLITDSFLKVVREKNWRPVSQAELLNLEEGEDIKFQLRVEVIPDFEVENYLGLELFKEEALPEDYLLNQALQELQEQYAVVKEVSRPAVVDDIVTMNLTILKDGKIENNQKNIAVKIGNRSLPDELNRALVGVKKSETKEVKAGEKIYKIKIKKIEERILPQIDEQFARKQNYENLEQLKKKLLENAKALEEKRQEEELKDSLSRILLERINFKVPKILIENEYNKILSRMELKDSDANKERFMETAEKRARLNIILDRIAEKEKITIKEGEVKNLISALGIKVTEENRINLLNYFTDILTREKTIDFLFKHAKINERSRIISPKEARDDTRTVRH
ncbi:MAG TPA: trigger factor [candidate division WOR-3 bacterium]|uniref:Trigger factor n=1 Tax=candidate division WOR-3 bacterium TaxID=2052148 RepID=A0A9C9JZG5_UNCW3|nr:trigger factor [candidate division WOR-3 bacterium]